MRSTRLKEDTLKGAMLLIQSLDPRPGQSINTGESEYVIPDVLVRKVSGVWSVELNSDSIPRLKINQQYAAMGEIYPQRQRRTVYPQQSAGSQKWLIKEVWKAVTIPSTEITRCIVEQQQAFFESVMNT